MKAHIIDIINRTIFDADIIIRSGKIEQLKKLSQPLPEDAPYAMPGFVDSHIHIESSLLTPEHFAPLAVRQGTIACVCDPHEIANVMGVDGIDFMIENAKRVRFHFHFGAPSCVPATPFETSGAKLNATIVAELLKRDDIYGLAEVMNVPGVLNHDPDLMGKLAAARSVDKPIDGHAPGVTGNDILHYIKEGITTDHECTTLDEARERITIGMKILIREGSAACDFEHLTPLLGESDNMIMFCTDDKYADELREGHINQLVRRSLAKGYPLWNVLNAACLTPVKHYHLNHGLLREGDNADFIIVDNLHDFNILHTFINGCEVFNKQQGVVSAIYVDNPIPVGPLPNNFHASHFTPDDIIVTPPHADAQMKVIVAHEGSLYTQCQLVKPLVVNNQVVPDIENDILKLVVIDRYTQCHPQVAFIHGFGLKQGAIASTIAHDCHNIIALGCSDQEIITAINKLVQSEGGLCVCHQQSCIELPLPIAGLMSNEPPHEVARLHQLLKAQAASQGCRFAAPFMTLSFMCLPVIPELKLSDQGLFDGVKFNFTSLFE